MQQGHRLITLPNAAHLTYGANDDPRLLALIEKVPSELWGAKLALQLIAQRLQGGESQFASYVAELPKGFPGIPVFFPRTALDMIDYPPCSQQVSAGVRCNVLCEGWEVGSRRWALGHAFVTRVSIGRVVFVRPHFTPASTQWGVMIRSFTAGTRQRGPKGPPC